MTISEWEQANRESIDRRRAEYDQTRYDHPFNYEVEMYKRQQGMTKANIEIAKVREVIEDLVNYKSNAKSLPIFTQAGGRMLESGIPTGEVIELLRLLYDAAQIDAKIQLEENNNV